jgi:hypothetical protein
LDAPDVPDELVQSEVEDVPGEAAGSDAPDGVAQSVVEDEWDELAQSEGRSVRPGELALLGESDVRAAPDERGGSAQSGELDERGGSAQSGELDVPAEPGVQGGLVQSDGSA